ncbi:MAG: M20 family metallopeptidase [Alphaproteobacteria bacterium]|nr:M20 family metallopeptidase [Alphaproteobacteria bacterium]
MASMDERTERALDALTEARVVELAQGALRIPSLSGEERAVATYFAARMREAGLEAELQDVPPSIHMGPSVNAIGRLRGTVPGPTLLFNGHIDHNPVCDGWSKDPFGGTIEDDWLYGFVHMKSANAAYVAAAKAVRRAGIPLAGTVVIAHVCGELRGGAGTRHALRSGITADYFVLGEPTELEIGTRHTASIVLDLHVRGQMRHFSTPQTGGEAVNAIEKMARVIAALGPSHRPAPARRDGGWLSFEPKAGFDGLPQFNIGAIQGGISTAYDRSRPALFPDLCSISLDVRIVPGMNQASIAEDLERLLAGLKATDPELDWAIEFRNDTFPLPFDAADDSAVVRAVASAHRTVRGTAPQPATYLKYAASDASWMAAAGIPGVIYGPSGRYLSRPDERCAVKDIVDAARVYACVIAALCDPARVTAAA